MATYNQINNSLRSYDFAGRWGGDEFLLLLIGANRTGAQIIGERICKAIGEKHISLSGTGSLSMESKTKITACIGIDQFLGEDKDVTFDALFAKADKALYLAKLQGKNTMCVFKE